MDAGLGVHRLAAHLSVNVPAFGCEAARQHPAEPSIRSDDQDRLAHVAGLAVSIFRIVGISRLVDSISADRARLLHCATQYTRACPIHEKPLPLRTTPRTSLRDQDARDFVFL